MIAEPLPGDGLAAMFDIAWQRLEQAVVDPASALRWPMVATLGGEGPSARLMVLRSVDREARTLCFYTDSRAAKVAEIAGDPRVAITGYETELGLQLRLQGVGRLLTGGAVADRWREVGESARQAYATLQPPGAPLDAPGSGLPAEIPAGDTGANFAVLEVTISQLEWLLLASTGHRRARYEHISDAWQGSWRVP